MNNFEPTPCPIHDDASDLDRASLEFHRSRGLRAFMLSTAVLSAVGTTALLILTAVLWGAS